MHSQQTVYRFIALRAQGWSLGRAAAHLNISRSTAYEWHRQNQAGIDAFKTVILEEALEKCLPAPDKELSVLSMRLSEVQRALAKRDLESLDTPRLLRLELELTARLGKLRRGSVSASPEPPAIPPHILDEIFAASDLATAEAPHALAESPCNQPQ